MGLRGGVWPPSVCQSSPPELRGLLLDTMKWERVFRETWGFREPKQLQGDLKDSSRNFELKLLGGVRWGSK